MSLTPEQWAEVRIAVERLSRSALECGRQRARAVLEDLDALGRRSELVMLLEAYLHMSKASSVELGEYQHLQAVRTAVPLLQESLKALTQLLHEAREEGSRAAELAVAERLEEGRSLEEIISRLEPPPRGWGSLADNCDPPKAEEEAQALYIDVWCAAVRARQLSLQTELKAVLEALGGTRAPSL